MILSLSVLAFIALPTINVHVWRDSQPTGNTSGIIVNLDTPDSKIGNATHVRVVHGTSVWESPLETVPTATDTERLWYKASRKGPSWPIGDKVDISIKIDNRWHAAGAAIIASSN